MASQSTSWMGAGFQNCGAFAPQGVGHGWYAVAGADIAGFSVTNDGVTWRPANIGITFGQHRVASVQGSETVANRLYAFCSRTGDGTGANAGIILQGTYSPTTGFITWTQLATLSLGVQAGVSTQPRQIGKLLALDEANDVAFVGNRDGVWRITLSTGATSQRALAGSHITGLLIDPLNKNIGWATADADGSGAGFYRIANIRTGTVTTTVNSTWTNPQDLAYVDDGTNRRVWVAAGSQGIRRWAVGTDASTGWTDMTGSYNQGGNICAKIAARASGGVTTVVAMNAGNASMTNAGAVSTDSGSTWQNESSTWTVSMVPVGETAAWWLSVDKPAMMLTGGSYDASTPHFDPVDGNWVMLFGRSGIWRIDLAGGISARPMVRGLAVTVGWTVAFDPTDPLGLRAYLGDGDWTFGRSSVGFVTGSGMPDMEQPITGTGQGLAYRPDNGRLAVATGETSANNNGEIYVSSNPHAATPTWTSQGFNAVSGGVQCKSVAIGENGSGSQVLLTARLGVGIQRKLGSGTPTTVEASFPTSGNLHPRFCWPQPNANVARQHVYASANNGLWYSDDRGATWTKVLSYTNSSEYSGSLVADPTNPDTLYLSKDDGTGGGTGLFKITNASSGAPTLTKIGPTITEPGPCAVHPTSGLVFICTTADESGGPKLYRSPTANPGAAATFDDITDNQWKSVIYPFDLACSKTSRLLVSNKQGGYFQSNLAESAPEPDPDPPPDPDPGPTPSEKAAGLVQLQVDGVWTDITSLVYGRDDLVITRGAPDEATQVDRSTGQMTVNNRSGIFSPRNPLGQYYGLIGRNTRLRVRKDPGPPGYLMLGGAYNSNALSPSAETHCETPDDVDLGITGDIDIRIDFEQDHWNRWGAGLAAKYTQTADQRSWSFWVEDDGTLTFTWSTDGTGAGLLEKSSTTPATVPASGRLAVRVTLDVNNGAAGNDVKFYTSDTIDGTWSQLGSTVTTGTVTSIFDSTATLQVGRSHTTNSGGDLRGRVYAFQLREGIDGPMRADVDFNDDAEAGVTSFVGSDGLPWTLSGDAYLVDPAVRFYGEVSSWPQRWDVSGSDVYVPLEASGIFRRLGQGAPPLKSTLLRGYATASFTPRAYWPCEDGEDARVIATPLAGGIPMRPTDADSTATTPDFASNDDFKCSSPLPTMTQVEMTGLIPSYTHTGKVQLFFLLKVPSTGTTNGQGLIDLYTTGAARRWVIVYGTGGTLDLRLQDADGTTIESTGAVAFDVDGKLLRIDLELEQNALDVDYSLATLEVGADFGNVTSGSATGIGLGRATKVTVDPGANLDGVVFGHISVHSEILSLFDLWEELNAYAGEPAARRIERLCAQENITVRLHGDPEDTTAMGFQLPRTLLELLRECAATDGGVLFEPRDLLGLAYRPRQSMYDQRARLTLDYSANDLSVIEPIDDDRFIRNDITVTRVDGAKARVVKASGPLSIEAPPDGVGLYDEEVPLSLETDDQAQDLAGWRVHLGTVDEARYPNLKVDLGRSNFTSNTPLALAVEDLDVGDRLVVENPPGWLPPDDITQLASGFVEVISNFIHTIEVNCAPSSPWDQAANYDGADKYMSDGSTLNEDLDETETAVDIATSSGPLWSHADGDFDILIAGERMTVTAVSGASSPQTFTVTRSVNGVSKSHTSGAEVILADRAVYVP